nr:putative serpin-Z5 [Setaria viridis]
MIVPGLGRIPGTLGQHEPGTIFGPARCRPDTPAPLASRPLISGIPSPPDRWIEPLGRGYISPAGASPRSAANPSSFLPLPVALSNLGLDLTQFRPAGHSFSEMVALAEADDEDMLPPMAVPSIIQQCSVRVNERGTVAAAATELEILGFAMGKPEPVVDFVADHPFLFFIKEDHSRVVLFAGQVLDPSSPR